MSSERVELVLERLSEDSSMTGELDDHTASVLLQWAEQEVKAADVLNDNAAFEERVMAVRSAARTAARPTTRSGDTDPADVIVKRAAELLNAALQTPTVTVHTTEPSTRTLQVAPDLSDHQEGTMTPTGDESKTQVETPPTATPPRSPWQMLRRRIRRWTHRKA